MLMAIKDIFKVSRKTFLDPSAWIGIPEIKDSTKTIWQIIRGLVTIPTTSRTETFEEALIRMNLTEQDIKEQSERYFIYAVVFATLVVVTLVFAFYLLLVDWAISGFLIGLAVAALFASQAFRYHFWCFQIQQRKLGCTFQEWKQSWGRSSPGPSA
jgi:intracellular multiplication protein IcmV